MVRQRSLFLIVIVGLFYNVFAGTSGKIEITAFSNSLFKKDSFSIAVYPLISDRGQNQFYFSELLTGRLIFNGHRIVERAQLVTVFEEIIREQAGVVKDGNTESNVVERLSKNDLKKIGEIAGIDVILFFSFWNDNKIAFHIVDCQTANILLSGTCKAWGMEDKFKDFDEGIFQVHAVNLIADVIQFSIKGHKEIYGTVNDDLNFNKWDKKFRRKGLPYYFRFSNAASLEE